MSDIAEALKKTDADKAAMLARYRELCVLRDQVNARNAPIEAELAQAVAATQAARERELVLAEQIDANRGADWLALKRRIGELARALRFIPAE
jgi:hypothetical protein